MINEVMASNLRTKADPQGQFDDWIEIYNFGSTPIDIGGMYLTDDPERPTKWQIPAADPALTTIARRGYLLIWADGSTGDPGLHASFKLNAGGEEVGLFDADGTTLIDSMTFPTLARDVSYGRCPDAAGGTWRFFAPPRPGRRIRGATTGWSARSSSATSTVSTTSRSPSTLATDTPEATIYYTLDGETARPGAGTEPSPARSTRVPSRIDKTTCLRAVAIKEGWKPSAVRTQTYIFVSDVIKQSPTGAKPGPGWPEPDAGAGGNP